MCRAVACTYRVLNTTVCNLATNYVCPQVQHMGRDYPWEEPTSITAIVTNRPLLVPPNMRAFHLDPATNLTDVISQSYISAMGLLGSDRLVALLARYVLQAYEVYAAEVINHGCSYKYNWIHMIEDVEDLLEFGKCEFVVVRPDGRMEVSIISGPDLLRAKRIELAGSMEGHLRGKRLVFKAGSRRLDLFCLRLTGFVFYLSERLANDLVQHQLNGFEIEAMSIPVDFPEG